jgi:hypothetical protein
VRNGRRGKVPLVDATALRGRNSQRSHSAPGEVPSCNIVTLVLAARLALLAAAALEGGGGGRWLVRAVVGYLPLACGVRRWPGCLGSLIALGAWAPQMPMCPPLWLIWV